MRKYTFKIKASKQNKLWNYRNLKKKRDPFGSLDFKC